MAGAKNELERLEAAIMDAAGRVLEHRPTNPYLALQLIEWKALGASQGVEIGERIPAVRDNRDEWEKGPHRG